MKLGMSGSQGGVSEFRVTHMYKFLCENIIEEVNHGDCVGADAHFHKSTQDMDIDIVDSTDFLLAFPGTENEIKRSGTWSTYKIC